MKYYLFTVEVNGVGLEEEMSQLLYGPFDSEAAAF